MAWTDPTQRSTGELITQSIYNTDLIDNLSYLIASVEPNMTNRSGGSVDDGTVVINDISNDNSFKTTTTDNDDRMLGVVRETIANLSNGRVATSGICTVKVQGNVTRGNYLAASTTAGRAKDGGTLKSTSTFAVALTAYSGGGAGTVTALLLPAASGGGVPQYAVFYTTAGSAPAGYVEYTAARGRVIVGLPSGGSLGGTLLAALSDMENRTHTHVYTTVIAHTHAQNVLASGAGTENHIANDATSTGTANLDSTGSTGSASASTQATSHMMPYIQLLAIQKS